MDRKSIIRAVSIDFASWFRATDLKIPEAIFKDV
jgi:hypothetical protein